MSSSLDPETTTPLLRLNLPMHTAMINRIDVDEAEKYLLTCSNDKTAKLWELPAGKLIRTFRPPIGEGDEGMLYAGAISPDGTTIALGGWTSDNGLNNHIYFFDTTSGQMVYRIGGLQNVILDLKYSPDGRYLAASMGGRAGLKVYRSRTFSEVFTDQDYSENSYCIAFALDGRMATVSFDGYVRLYSQHFELQKKVPTSGGKQPFRLAFSPNGKHLAVGYDDSATVQILNGSDLSVAFPPDIKGAEELSSRINIPAFSKDGKTLLAGGLKQNYHAGKWWFIIRKWSEAGLGSYIDIPASSSSIMDIKPFNNDQMAFSSAQPDWGIIDLSKDERILYKNTAINGYAKKDLTHLRINRDGFEIGFQAVYKPAFTFYLSNRNFEKRQSNQTAFKDAAGDIHISDWEDSYSPKLNGKPLDFLASYEICRSVDITSDQSSILFGAQWNIYCLDKTGKKLWKQATQAEVFAVNIAGNKQVAVGAFDDGTLRWYRMSDGRLLLTLFLHSDDEHWILWTPSGYYDAAPGAESMLGWHVNQGADQEALFYPMSHFRDKYYRPDVIDRILETYDEEEAVRRANEASAWRDRGTSRGIVAALPPTVRIESPAPGTQVADTSVTITYSIQSPNKENIDEVSILVDARPVSKERGFNLPGSRAEATVTIPRADCTISIIAKSRFGTSDPATVSLKWSGPTPGDVLKPKLYLLAIGVSAYENPDYTLHFAAKDAADFAAGIARQKGLLYRDIETKILTDGHATKDDILDGLDWIQKETTRRDIAMIFFAGHGMDDNAQNFYFLPVNADLDRLKRTGILKTDIETTVSSIAGKIIVFMDACHSGGLMKKIGRRGTPDITRIINELISAENGAVVFSSATSRQYALENFSWNNGAFTKALVEGLMGAADYHQDGKITVKTLDAYITERVKQLTDGQQSPTTHFPPDVEDFPIAVLE